MMLLANRSELRPLLFKGGFGLEKESLRVTEEGFLAQTPHPFPDDPHIVRDFCENQTEINTPVASSPQAAVTALEGYYQRIQETLAEKTPREYLWPFSNPPYIRSESDIPVARFSGGRASKTAYRDYLSARYGRYKMTFSGIHVNFSFDETLLEENFRLSGEADFAEAKNTLYLHLAKGLVRWGWLLVILTAASPVLDSSYTEKGKLGGDVFSGMASVRCSDMGYWNFFSPVLDYSDLRAYAESIQQYVASGWIKAPSELYYPIRLKPAGRNNLAVLRETGVNHIELRMFDLNPLTPAGVEVRDVQFAHLMMVWLAAQPDAPLGGRDQVQAIQNFKNAAHYDLKTVRIVLPEGETCSAVRAAQSALRQMRDFYRDAPAQVQSVLDFEEEKLTVPEKRYAWQLRQRFSDGYVENGLALAKKRQSEVLSHV